MGVKTMGVKVTTEITTTFGDADRLHIDVTKKEKYKGFMKVESIRLYDGMNFIKQFSIADIAVLRDVVVAADEFMLGTQIESGEQ